MIGEMTRKDGIVPWRIWARLAGDHEKRSVLRLRGQG